MRFGHGLEVTSGGSGPQPSVDEAKKGLTNFINKSSNYIASFFTKPAGKKSKRRDRKDEQCEIFLYGKKLDVKDFMRKHPGGAKPLRIFHGRDATEVFEAYHTPEARKQAEQMLKLFGKEMTEEEKESVRAPRDQSIADAFIAFRRQLETEGYFDIRWGSEILKTLEFAAMWIGGTLLLRYGDGFLLKTAGLLLYTLAIQQLGWYSHDHSHHSTSISPWFSDLVADVSAIIQTYNRDWWKARHNTHHVSTNELHNDPDIKTAPVFTYMAGVMSVATGHNPLAERPWHNAASHMAAVTDAVAAAAAASPTSTCASPTSPASGYPSPVTSCASNASSVAGAKDSLFVPKAIGDLSRVQVHQSRYFYPVMSLLHVYWVVESYMFVVMRLPRMWPQLLGLWASYGLVYWTFANAGWSYFLAFVILKGLGTSLVVFATHYGETRLPPTHTLSLAEQTALTTRNISGGPFGWMNWFSGGISLQIEHHLFPRMPRANLLRVQPKVKAFFKEHGLVWNESSFTGCLQRNVEQLDCTELGHLATMS